MLMSVQFVGRRTLLDRLTQVGEIAALFAQARDEPSIDPPLTALEVLEALRFLPAQKRSMKFDILRSLWHRAAASSRRTSWRGWCCARPGLASTTRAR
jgi:hypothetical protein